MNRSERRRMAREMSKMSLSELDKAISDIADIGIEKGFRTGIRQAELLFKKAMNEELGIGEKRYNRVINHIENKLKGE